jgi:hypothetical protein
MRLVEDCAAVVVVRAAGSTCLYPGYRCYGAIRRMCDDFGNERMTREAR